VRNNVQKSPEINRFAVLKRTSMFEDYIGSGANAFIAIVAVIVGFVAAMGYIDYLKVKRKEKKEEGH
jgi:hypothetical protein